MTDKLYKSPIKLAGGEESFVCPQSLVLNSYMGCSHQCVYCYAKFVLDIYKKFDEVVPADVSVVEKTMIKAFEKNGKDSISQLIRRRVPFRFSNLTDPFQEAEHEYHATYDILEVLSKWNYPAILNTKGVIESESKYINILKKIPCVLQLTITSDNDDLSSRIEPGAPVVSKRLDALKTLSDNGIITQVRYSPVFPVIADDPLELFKKCKENGANDIVCEFARLPLSHKYLDALNKALGYDYLEMLKEKQYPIVKSNHWWKVEIEHKFKELIRFKQVANDIGLNFYICCEERPEINNWKNCCGTDKYPGMESCMDWTIQMNGDKIKSEKTPFNDYIQGKSCPYNEDFEKFWNKGRLKTSLSDMQYDNDTNTYKREKKIIKPKQLALERFI
jgi:DNA repair photolyase